MGSSRPARHPSLRWRLLRVVGVAALVVWSLTGLLSYQRALHEAEEMMDGHLAHTARLLQALTSSNESRLDVLAERLAAVNKKDPGVYEPPLEFQIGRGNGSILIRSADAPNIPILGAPGFSEIERDGNAWRLLNTVSEDGAYRIQVSQAMSVREYEAFEVASQTSLPLAIILPLLLLALYLSIRRGLKPLDELAADVAARSPENLAALPREHIPQEVRPLVVALNRLLGRLDQALESERRFTADAAHELRTPLAAVKIQTQVALASSDPEKHAHALQQVLAGVDRSSRLVDQLLRLARLDPLADVANPQPVDLLELAEDAVLAGNGGAEGEAARVSLGQAASATVLGDGDLLAIAVRNLVDNALRYAPPPARVRIEVGHDENGIRLAVIDHGPGVPPADLGRLTERFYRGRDVAGEGSGLGLAIVARIAELHGARLEFANGGEGGFSATLRW